MRMLKKSLLTISGLLAGAAESRSGGPLLCFFIMIPLFYAADTADKNESPRRALVMSCMPFLVGYDFAKTAFMLQLYRSLDYSIPVGVLFSVIAAVGTSLILLTAQTVCLYFYNGIKKEGAAGVAIFSLLFAGSEWLCEHLGPLSFAWLGVWAQADGAEWLLMSSKLFGCRFTSFIIMMINGLLYLTIVRLKRQNFISSGKALLASAAIVSGCAVYGLQETVALKTQDDRSEGISVAAMQLDCEGSEKSEIGSRASAGQYLSMIKSLEKRQHTELIFLPETAVNTTYKSGAEQFSGIEKFCSESGCTVLTGCFYRERDGKHNSVIALTPNGISKEVYSKAHLVPFGEYVPFSWATGEDSLAASVSERKPIDIGGVEIGCGICIESTYSDIFREQARRGAELFYIPTNDSWFGNSAAREAHYMHAKIRAIENSRYTVRAGNCGISAVITPWGEELSVLSTKERGAVTAEIKPLGSKSVYTVVGDSFILLPLALICISASKSANAKFHLRNRA